MTAVRLGAVGYLNARPLVYGLDRHPEFSLRFDVPSRCADLLHEGAIDLGLIPSIEYLRGENLHIVPDLAIASRGPVASVAIYTAKEMRDVRSIALDTSSRTSVALVSVLCARAFHITPAPSPAAPDLDAMLGRADAALIIGDNALFHGSASTIDAPAAGFQTRASSLQKIDLGDTWTSLTGLPFVYAFWAGKPGAIDAGHVRTLQAARDAGVANTAEIASAFCPDSPERRDIAARYLQDNIRYRLGDDERAGAELFFRYAAETGVVASTRPLSFY
jgi:predicted solute-binding protein